jgi:acetyltransferase-like isoleucine patch superfamily enzyme
MLHRIKSLIKNLLYRPRGLRALGERSYVTTPAYLRHKGCISIGVDSFIHRDVLITPIVENCGVPTHPHIDIGDHVYIGIATNLSAIVGIKIGDGCVVSDYVFMCDTSHGFDPNGGMIMDQPLSEGREIVIGEGSFIGRNVFIAPGVELGVHCVVGAYSLVNRSFGDYTMIVGSPARAIKRFCLETGEWVAYHE